MVIMNSVAQTAWYKNSVTLFVFEFALVEVLGVRMIDFFE